MVFGYGHVPIESFLLRNTVRVHKVSSCLVVIFVIVSVAHKPPYERHC